MRTASTCVLVVVCLRSGLAPAAVADGEEKKAVPLYTNADLDRISPYRGETGVNSRPAAPPPAADTSVSGISPRGEAYWRQEADRLRDRLRPLQERAAELRVRIEERRRQPPRRGTVGDPQREALERRLHDLEARVRDMESRFEDRARRERALPGWLR